MGVYVCVISKTKRNIKSFIESRLVELEENLNTDFINRYIYYSEDEEYVYISNRIRLIRILRQKSTVNLIALSNICLMGSTLGTVSSVNEINRLPQGSFITVYNGRLSIWENELYFWNDKQTKLTMSEFRRFFQMEITACANRLVAYIKKEKNLISVFQAERTAALLLQ